MEQYKANLKASILLALVDNMAVQPIRIQDLQVDECILNALFCEKMSLIAIYLIRSSSVIMIWQWFLLFWTNVNLVFLILKAVV
jgi:hypothetical protein